MARETSFTWRGSIFAFLAFVASLVAFFGCTDNLISRRVFDLYVDSLASRARSRPNHTEHAKALIAIARGPTLTLAEKHRAVSATYALGTLGPAAAPVLRDIVDLLASSNNGVSQQAAWALAELGPVASPVADEIALRIERGPLDETAWMAVEALATCGAAAEKHIPMLRALQGREPAMFSRTVTRAIADIEFAKSQRKIPKDRHKP